MSDFTGPDGNGYSFPALPATAAAWDTWKFNVLLALSGGGPFSMPGDATRASVSAMPTTYLLQLVRAGCLTSP
jgi:hypothetical protein